MRCPLPLGCDTGTPSLEYLAFLNSTTSGSGSRVLRSDGIARRVVSLERSHPKDFDLAFLQRSLGSDSRELRQAAVVYGDWKVDVPDFESAGQDLGVCASIGEQKN